MHLQLEKISQCQTIWSDPEVSFVFWFLFCWWAVICNIPRVVDFELAVIFLIWCWCRSEHQYVHCLWVWIKMLIYYLFEHSLWSQSYNFPKEFRFFWTASLQLTQSPLNLKNFPLISWHKPISMLTAPTDKTSGLSKVLRIWFPCFDSQFLRTQQWIRKWYDPS